MSSPSTSDVEIDIASDAVSVTDNTSDTSESSTLCSSLIPQELINEPDINNFCDVTIKFSGRCYGAHKNILYLASGWFQRAFDSGFKESTAAVIEVFDDDADALYRMLSLCYSALYPSLVNHHFPSGPDDEKPGYDNIVKTYIAADKYDCGSVKSSLVELISASGIKSVASLCRGLDCALLMPTQMMEPVQTLITNQIDDGLPVIFSRDNLKKIFFREIEHGSPELGSAILMLLKDRSVTIK